MHSFIHSLLVRHSLKSSSFATALLDALAGRLVDGQTTLRTIVVVAPKDDTVLCDLFAVLLLSRCESRRRGTKARTKERRSVADVIVNSGEKRRGRREVRFFEKRCVFRQKRRGGKNRQAVLAQARKLSKAFVQ